MDSILEKTRCYLSGPMDFVGSRVIEKYLGWRAILTPILKAFSIRVLDPWNKPMIRGHENYGQEGITPNKEQYERDFWTNAATRAQFERDFWETVHIDLRMTDISDFVISFVPTNIYSVGTVHEIIVARNQRKPVLMVSPPIKYDFFPELANLPDNVKRALKFYGLKENPQGIPSQWYGNIVGFLPRAHRDLPAGGPPIGRDRSGVQTLGTGECVGQGKSRRPRVKGRRSRSCGLH